MGNGGKERTCYREVGSLKKERERERWKGNWKMQLKLFFIFPGLRQQKVYLRTSLAFTTGSDSHAASSIHPTPSKKESSFSSFYAQKAACKKNSKLSDVHANFCPSKKKYLACIFAENNNNLLLAFRTAKREEREKRTNLSTPSTLPHIKKISHMQRPERHPFPLQFVMEGAGCIIKAFRNLAKRLSRWHTPHSNSP